jgi:hypothetical protein
MTITPKATTTKTTMSPSHQIYSSTTASHITTHQPSSDYIKQAFTTTLQDNTSLHATLATLRQDYLALETDYRESMAAYILARDEAWKWHRLCVEENDYAREQGTHGSCWRRMFGAEKVGEVWRRRDEWVWVRERSGERFCGRKLERFREGLGRWRAEVRRGWGEWRVRRREKSERSAEVARMWREDY